MLEALPGSHAYAFEIHTDHNNLMYFMRSQNLSKRQARWQLWMSQFNYSLVYQKGTAMHVADPLSRCSDHYVHSSEDNKEQVLLQPESVNKIVDASEKSHEDRQSIISEFHDLPSAGHKGNKATYNTLWKHYRWKGMKEQVQQYVKHCQRCQRGKATNKAPAGELLPLPTPQGPWQDITVDFTEMPESLSYNNILVVIDQFSKEAVFIPCTKEENALTTAKRLEITSGANMVSLPRLFLIMDRSLRPISWVNYIKSWRLKERCLQPSIRRLMDRQSD